MPGSIALATAFPDQRRQHDRIAGLLAALRDWPAWLLIVGVCLDVLLSEIASNTATAVLLMPILAATATANGLDPAHC